MQSLGDWNVIRQCITVYHTKYYLSFIGHLLCVKYHIWCCNLLIFPSHHELKTQNQKVTHSHTAHQSKSLGVNPGLPNAKALCSQIHTRPWPWAHELTTLTLSFSFSFRCYCQSGGDIFLPETGLLDAHNLLLLSGQHPFTFWSSGSISNRWTRKLFSRQRALRLQIRVLNKDIDVSRSMWHSASKQGLLHAHGRHSGWRRWRLPKLGARKSCTAAHLNRMSHCSPISVPSCWKLRFSVS